MLSLLAFVASARVVQKAEVEAPPVLGQLLGDAAAFGVPHALPRPARARPGAVQVVQGPAGAGAEGRRGQPFLVLAAETPGDPGESTVDAAGCEQLLRELFDGAVDPSAVAAACSAQIVWDDVSAAAPAEGPAAVRDLLASKFPAGSRLVIDRLSDGRQSGGFTWHREAVTPPGETSDVGLRGTLFAELDSAGKLAYVREASEPILKPGEATEALLKAATANAEKPAKPPPSYTPATPTTASSIVRYLWEEAYPNGAEPTEALRLFADDIRYEDFNYPEPFLGKAAVKEFVEAFDIPGIEFVLTELSGGDDACCFTWSVTVNGAAGPNGVSFYGCDDEGRIDYIRDIPATAPAPLQQLAALFNPALRKF